MTDRRRFLSLHVKLLLVLLLGIALGVGVYFLSGWLGGAAVDRYYLSRDAVERRSDELAQELQSYVTQNGLSSRDSDAIARWTMRKQDVYVLLYKDQSLAVAANWRGVEDGGGDAAVPPENLKMYPIFFRDGVFQAVIYEFSVERLLDLLMLASLVLGFVTMAAVLQVYNRRVVRDIIEVSREVRQIGEGDLRLELVQKRHDELGLLTASVDQMRRSILRKTEQEQQAVARNSELITAMSHDIRNPLTALLGYLDLARGGHWSTQEELDGYIEAARTKAGQLKTLTDELFRYALLFGADTTPASVESYDGPILIGQMLEENRALLEQQGFRVRITLPVRTCTVRADAMYLKRVFDNLFDNIRKYADPAEPVCAAAERQGGELRVCLANSVRTDAARIESNRIGLRTCARLMERMGGRFTRRQEKGRFTAELYLPLEKGREGS